MNTRLDHKPGYTVLEVSGDVGLADQRTLRNLADQLLLERPSSLLIDIEGASISIVAFAPLVAVCYAVVAAEGGCAILTRSEEIRESFTRLALARLAKVCADRDVAFRSLLARLRKRYDTRFFSLLVKHGYLERYQLKEALTTYRAQEQKVPFGDILMERGYADAPTILNLLALADKTAEAAATPPAVARPKSAPSRPRGSSRRERKKGPSEFVRPSLLGEILVEMEVISRNQLKQVLEEQQRSASEEKIGDALLRKGLVSANQLLQALEAQYNRRAINEPPSPDGVQEEKLKPVPGPSEFIRSSLTGQMLLELNLITEAQLKAALEQQKRAGRREKLGDILIRIGAIKPVQLMRVLQVQTQRKG